MCGKHYPLRIARTSSPRVKSLRLERRESWGAIPRFAEFILERTFRWIEESYNSSCKTTLLSVEFRGAIGRVRVTASKSLRRVDCGQARIGARCADDCTIKTLGTICAKRHIYAKEE